MNRDGGMLNSKARLLVVCSMQVLLLVVILLVTPSGCGRSKPIPKEGDVVIWRHTPPELIIKAKLGQRREHVVADSRTDHLHYEPQYERFIGQFPIDYAPKPFPRFTEAERNAFLAEYASKIHAFKSGHPLEFNLMLNGVIAKATDASPHGGDMDNPNQVKVILGGLGILNNPPTNTKQFFERELMKELDVSSKKTEHGLDCYSFKDRHEGKRCFGHSTYPSISGFEFYVSPYGRNVLVESRETIYGGIRVQWFTHPKNLNRARDIDAAIWRLLEAWNVAPTQTKN